MSSKRPHSSSRSSSPPSPGLAKQYRAESEPRAAPLLCSLPPTCCHPRRPTELEDTKALEAHYAMCHAHVCEAQGCEAVFPDERLLELHHTECHDPIAKLKQERGEKIFACHIPTCSKMCITPKARRLHLIEAHGYPKQYFFAITNKGVGGLLRKWGDGVSLIRGSWKDRPPPSHNLAAIDFDSSLLAGDGPDHHRHDSRSSVPGAEHAGGPGRASSETTSQRSGSEEMDALALGFSTLSMVPKSIRFGRGGKAGGFGSAPAIAAGTQSSSAPEKKSRRGGRRGSGRGMPMMKHENAVSVLPMDVSTA